MIVFLKSTVRPLESVNCPSSKICNKIFNTSGDAFSISSNKTLKKSCELANIAAGLSIQHLGTVSVSKADLSNAIKKS